MLLKKWNKRKNKLLKKSFIKYLKKITWLYNINIKKKKDILFLIINLLKTYELEINNLKKDI